MITMAEIEEAYQKEQQKIKDEAKQSEQTVSKELGKVNVELDNKADVVLQKASSSHYTEWLVVALLICVGIIGAGIHKYFYC